jgi:transposase-like protein
MDEPRHGRIGGQLHYRDLSRLFRPSDPAALAREAVKLARLGLSVRDVAQAIGCEAAQVARWLERGDD